MRAGLFFLALILIILQSCSQPSTRLIVEQGERISIETDLLRLDFDSRMHWVQFYKKNGRLLSLNHPDHRDSLSLPSHFIKTAGTIISDFHLDYQQISFIPIKTSLGDGYRLTLRGERRIPPGPELEKQLLIEIYDQFPDMVVSCAVYRNLSGDSSVEISESWNSCLQLDASRIDPTLRPYEMCSFFGSAGRPTPGIDGLLPFDLDIENYTGRTEKLEGIKKGNGGIPVVDLWTREMGIAIGFCEPRWVNLYLPITVQENGLVRCAIRQDPAINQTAPLVLLPGESFTTIKTFTMVHPLDFYQPLVRFSQLMRLQDLEMHTGYTDADYASAWCSWNTVCTDAMQSKKDVMLLAPVLSQLDELEELGIQQVIFDAGWFNNQGDWLPNGDPRAFPRGETQLQEVIDLIHGRGFKVMLWISFLTADSGSQVANAHPEWMIQKENGENHLDRWSGNTMCPSLPEVREYHRELARRLVGKYGADGFKVDGMYTCPPCYNPAHRHADPNQPCQDYDKVFEAFYQEAKSIDPQVTVMVCPCGTIASFTTLPFVSQTIAADPPDYHTVRRFSKLYRALKGSHSPYSSDYTNVEEGILRLPTAIGCGAVPQNFHGSIPDAATFEYYRKWFSIYHREMLSKCDYLNHYDIFYDIPETYVFEKVTPEGKVLYYSFYADENSWEGTVELRGMAKDQQYQVWDYVNDRHLGDVNGDAAELKVSFQDYLLIKCIPKK